MPHLKRDAILTTNTSGLPVASIAAKLPEALRRRWFGTHFFNPPRYMRLVEIIPTPETDPAAIDAISQFADVLLGKEVVFARDTPNFIANRIGVFIMLEAVRLMQEEDLTIEEVDALTGTAIGWPRTGTFRLADMVGIDVLAHVAANFEGSGTMPPFVRTMLERRWLGDKTGRASTRKRRTPREKKSGWCWTGRRSNIVPAIRPKIPSLEMAKNAERAAGSTAPTAGRRHPQGQSCALPLAIAERAVELRGGLPAGDRRRCGQRGSRHARRIQLGDGPVPTLGCGRRTATVERMRNAGERVSPIVERLLAPAPTAWYRDHGGESFDVNSGAYRRIAVTEGIGRIAKFRAANGVVRHNPGASLVDLGDGVACLELHSKKNAMGEDIVRLVTETFSPGSNAVRDFEAFVISGDAEHFSVGANLMQLLLSAQEEEWDDVDFAVRGFQRMTAAIKFCPRPVVVAPYSFCLGGGAEIAMHGARRQAHAELYMGLVETGVGVVPAGGGCKEMLLRALDVVAAVTA